MAKPMMIHKESDHQIIRIKNDKKKLNKELKKVGGVIKKIETIIFTNFVFCFLKNPQCIH